MSIVWIGFNLQPYNQEHQAILKTIGVPEVPRAADGSEYLGMYAVTKDGDPICLNEYAASIAQYRSVQVMLFEDW